MPSVVFEDQSYSMDAGESVLDALLRHGVQVPHSCKAGSCGSCMMRMTRGPEGGVPARAQAGLKESWKARDYFLPCVCYPESDLAAARVGSDAQVAAVISALQPLSADVLRVRLACESPFDFRAGQYISLLSEAGLARSYSIASLPEDGELELHVRLLPQGRMSTWLRDQARPGTRVKILGPSGDCFYVPGREDQPLLLVGTGTGLAPLYGILRDAIQRGHRALIHLFHGAVQARGLYLQGELRELAERHRHFQYTAATLEESGPIDTVVLARYPTLAGWRGFICGDPGLVQSLKKKLFLSGMASRDIYADAFLPAAS